MGKRTVREVDVHGKRVLVRADLNVPIEAGLITDDTRIREAVPTVRYLLENGATAVILCSHLGRPQGRDESLSLAPVAGRLGNILGREVLFVDDCVGPDAASAVRLMPAASVLLLENLRFHKEEEANDVGFAKELASYADLYVDDAFGSAHRSHASTEGVTHFLPAVAGLLMAKEVRYLSALVANPPRPFAAVIGGAKVSTKILAIEHLLPKLNMLFLGGGMANTFFVASGVDVRMSLVEEEQVDVAQRILAAAKSRGVQVFLPVDVVAANAFAADAETKVVVPTSVPRGYMILDIGPETVNLFGRELQKAKSVMWNGPMGVFEMEKFSHGSVGIARKIAGLEATTVVGGGETVAVVAMTGLGQEFTHVSTGGGASLEMLEGKELPGVAALLDS
ncbi:MAG: phosphoglycerate kinase [Anaerolineaceae bacterium]